MRPAHPARLLSLALIGLLVLPAEGWAWGYAVHRLINRNAISNLPADFQLFSQWAGDLEALATAADERKCCVAGENIRHYIDIDDYAEFHAGTFPRHYSDAISRYGVSRLESNGIGPWALETSYHQLVTAFTEENWTVAVATAADIGHYAGDLHQPLHLTTNFDGQESGQSGVHSRFESRMTGRHMAEFTPFPGSAGLLSSPLDRVFEWIGTTYPGVARILAADRAARTAAGGSTSSDAYYNALWEEVGQDTWYWIGDASRDLAALWYTAWVEAGSPPLPGSIAVAPTTWSRIKGLVSLPVRSPAPAHELGENHPASTAPAGPGRIEAVRGTPPGRSCD